MAPLTILVASHTDSIYTLSFDPTPSTGSPTLELLARTPVGYHPSWIASHPSNKSIIYTGLKQADGEVVAIKYGMGGTVKEGEVVARAKSGGAGPCTLLVTEDELIIGNVSSIQHVQVVKIYPFSHSRRHPVYLGHNRNPSDINIHSLHPFTEPMDTIDAI
jgi:hypothetical protein